MIQQIKARLVERFGEELVNEIESLGFGYKLGFDNVRCIDACVFVTGVRDAKAGVLDTSELGFCSDAFSDAYMNGWASYLKAIKSRKKFSVKNL